MSKIQKVANKIRVKLADDKVMEKFVEMLRKWKSFNDLSNMPGLEMLGDLSALNPIRNRTMIEHLIHLAEGGEDWEGIGKFYPGWVQEDFIRYLDLLASVPEKFEDLPDEYKELL